jgi:hypothetical protein
MKQMYERKTLESLVDPGREQGYLTFDRVNDFLPQDVASPTDLRAALESFEDMDIKVLEEVPTEGPRARLTRSPKKRPKKRPPTPRAALPQGDHGSAACAMGRAWPAVSRRPTARYLKELSARRPRRAARMRASHRRRSARRPAREIIGVPLI